MKIEAKKSKLNLNKSEAARPGKKPAREPLPEQETVYVEKPQPKPRTKPPKTSAPKRELPKIKLPKIKLPSFSLPKIKLPALRARKPGLPKSGGKKKVYAIALIVAVPVLVIAVWLGMNLRKHPVPAPLFTESSLPPAPPADSNGYAYLYDNQVYSEYSPKDICDINLLRNAASMEYFMDKARPEYPVPRNLVDREDVKKMMGLYGDIMKKSSFADMAMPDQRDLQKVRVYIALNNAITASIVTRMQEKKFGAAFRMMKDLLDLNIRHMQSARSMNGYITSLQSYEKSLSILKSMLMQFGEKQGMGGDVIAVCRETGDMMRSFNPQGIPLDRIVMFEYILSWKQNFNPVIQHPEAAVRQGMKRKSLVFFDRGLTQKLFDERWKKLYDYAKQPAGNTPEEVRKLQEQRFAAGRFWWFHNAVGKKYLDSIPVPVFQLFQESRNWSGAINQKQGEIITIIGALKEEPKQEKKQVKKPARKQVKKQERKPKKAR